MQGAFTYWGHAFRCKSSANATLRCAFASGLSAAIVGAKINFENFE
jgi:hypothetical protein